MHGLLNVLSGSLGGVHWCIYKMSLEVTKNDHKDTDDDQKGKQKVEKQSHRRKKMAPKLHKMTRKRQKKLLHRDTKQLEREEMTNDWKWPERDIKWLERDVKWPQIDTGESFRVEVLHLFWRLGPTDRVNYYNTSLFCLEHGCHRGFSYLLNFTCLSVVHWCKNYNQH